MTDDLRPSPRHKPVSLFITCIIDAIYPQTGVSVVEILDHLGVEVCFPAGQTCCGQPAFNAGFWDDSRVVARQFLRAFEDAQVIVTPSGSCATMVRHYYPQLFRDDPEWYARATWAANITWEFTEYLVDGLGITDIGASLPPTTVAFHDACHGLRGLGLRDQARQLAASIDGVEVREMTGADQCCGFGGLFSVKMADISGAMLAEKIRHIEASDADILLTGDCSCMTQINGGLSRSANQRRVIYIADLLAQGLRHRQQQP
jgi:L-lactate dehydrogenase complex protein LldE